MLQQMGSALIPHLRDASKLLLFGLFPRWTKPTFAGKHVTSGPTLCSCLLLLAEAQGEESCPARGRFLASCGERVHRALCEAKDGIFSLRSLGMFDGVTGPIFMAVCGKVATWQPRLLGCSVIVAR